MDLSDLLTKSGLHLSEFLINVYLVYKRARRCCLLEMANIRAYSNKPLVDMEFVIELAKQVGLSVYKENENLHRYLIGYADVITDFQTAISEVKDNSEYHEILGKFLGFQSAGHQWSNWCKKRVSFHINVDFNQIFVFNCEYDKTDIPKTLQYIAGLSETFQRVLPNELTVSYYYEIDDGLETRIDAIVQRDLKYYQENCEDYYNDLENHWMIPSRLLLLFERSLTSQEALDENSGMLVKYWRLFVNDIDPEKINELDGLLD